MHFQTKERHHPHLRIARDRILLINIHWTIPIFIYLFTSHFISHTFYLSELHDEIRIWDNSYGWSLAGTHCSKSSFGRFETTIFIYAFHMISQCKMFFLLPGKRSRRKVHYGHLDTSDGISICRNQRGWTETVRKTGPLHVRSERPLGSTAFTLQVSNNEVSRKICILVWW